MLTFSASTPVRWMQTTWKYSSMLFQIEKQWWCCVESEFLKYLCFALFAFYTSPWVVHGIQTALFFILILKNLHPKSLKITWVYLLTPPFLNTRNIVRETQVCFMYEHPLSLNLLPHLSIESSFVSFWLGKMTSHGHKFTLRLWSLAENNFELSHPALRVLWVSARLAPVDSMRVHSFWLWGSKSAWLSANGVFLPQSCRFPPSTVSNLPQIIKFYNSEFFF